MAIGYRLPGFNGTLFGRAEFKDGLYVPRNESDAEGYKKVLLANGCEIVDLDMRPVEPVPEPVRVEVEGEASAPPEVTLGGSDD